MENSAELKIVESSVEPKIVFWDLETLPDMDAAMEVYTQIGDFPGRTLKASISSIICFGYRIYGKMDRAKCINAWDFPEWENDVNNDKALCMAAYEILKDADIIVTQNGKRFDEKVLQTRLMIHGLPPLPKINHVDIKQLAKSNLFMFSNSLKELAKHFTDDRKMSHSGWQLWVDVRKKIPEAMKTMSEYCAQDVDVMVPLFLRFRPFIKEFNMNVFRRDGAEACPSCGGFNLKSEGIRATTTRVYRRYCCKDCGKWSKQNVKKGPTSL